MLCMMNHINHTSISRISRSTSSVLYYDKETLILGELRRMICMIYVDMFAPQEANWLIFGIRTSEKSGQLIVR